MFLSSFCLRFSQVKESVISLRRRAAAPPRSGRRVPHASRGHGGVAPLGAAEAGGGAHRRGDAPAFPE